MIIRSVCAVRDSAMDAFMQPFFTQNVQVAVRSFTDMVNTADSPAFAHPKDYALYELGTFNEGTGRFENLEQPRQVCRAADVKRVDPA